MSQLITTTTITMSSIDLAELCEQRHDNFLSKVPLVLGDTVALNFKGYYTASNGKKNPCYYLLKREACLMAMSYSYELQAAVYDKMTALESQPVQPSFTIPQTLSEALRLAADQADLIDVLQHDNAEKTAVIGDLAPKAEFVEKYVDTTGSFGFRQAAKMLKIKENKFKLFLIQQGVMYYLDKSLMPYSQHIEAKRFEVKTGISDINGHAFTQARFTAKGISWIGGLLSKGVAIHD